MLQKNRKTFVFYLLAIIVICLAPFLVANYVYDHHAQLPLSKDIHGHLYAPTPSVHQLEFENRQQQSLQWNNRKKQWFLLYYTSSCCYGDLCQKNVYNLRAARGILVKDERRFHSFVLMPHRCQAENIPALMLKDDSVTPLYYKEKTRDQLKSIAEVNQHAIAWKSDQIFIVDPTAHLVLHYRADQPPRDWLQDFKHLLKVGSHA